MKTSNPPLYTVHRTGLESRHSSRIVIVTTALAVTAAVWFILFCASASSLQPNIFQIITDATIFRTSGKETRGDVVDSWCPLPDPISPSAVEGHDGIILPSSSLFEGEEWLERQVERLAAAINIPTESYDDNGDVDEDPRWEPFGRLHEVLEEMFPNVYAILYLYSN